MKTAVTFLKSLIAIALYLSAAAVYATPQEQALQQLASQINARFDIMPAVAAWKKRNDKPIEDLGREHKVLQMQAQSACKYNLIPTSTTSLFKIQIELAKKIQRSKQQYWQENPRTFSSVSNQDLSKELRPQISKIGTNILKSLSQYLASGYQFDHAAKQQLEKQFSQQQGLSKEDIEQLIDALAKVRYSTKQANCSLGAADTK